VHLICNAHLDPVWLWEWPEGAAEALSTFRTAAGLCREFPGFVFNHNEALLYRWVEEFEPGLFAELQELVKENTWHIMGGWQLQPDCNLPSGESLVRQVMLGRRYFYERFGVEPRTAVNLDSFGHSRGLVQILAKTGFESYLFCRPGPPDLSLPGEEFIWVGFDGSEILASRASAHYNSRRGEARKKLEAWVRSHPDKDVSALLWGIGNHGGGPSRQDLEGLDRFMKENGEVTAVHSTPDDYFADLAPLRAGLPRYEQGLNPWAVGCYTSMARVKKKHRLLENALFSAEKMAAAAFVQKLMPYPLAELRGAQADLAFGEFHDILPGSSSPAGEEGALRLLDHGLEICSRVKARAFFALAQGETRASEGEVPIFVHNPHPYRLTGLVECEFQPAEPNEQGGYLLPRVFDGECELPSQPEQEQSTLSPEWRKKVVFRAGLEPGGMNRFRCSLERVPAKPAPVQRKPNSPIRVQTAWGEVMINGKTGLLDGMKCGSKSFLKKNAFQPTVMRDNADSWGQNVRRFQEEAGSFRLLPGAKAAWLSGSEPGPAESVRIIEDGPVRTVVEAVLAYGHSTIIQRYKVSKLDPELEVELRVQWNEKDVMLKLRIPTSFPGSACLGQTAYGVEEIPSNGDESAGQKWTAVVAAGKKQALTVINDRTYGLDFSEGVLRLSLLRAPAYAADASPEKPLRAGDRFVPRQDQGEHVFRFWVSGGPARERLAAVDREALARNEKPYALSYFPPGTGPKALPAVVLSDEAVQMTAFKKAEDGDDLIIRLHEPTGQPRSTTVSLPWAGAKQEVRLQGFEVKTLRFDHRTGLFIETDLLERSVAAPPQEQLQEKGKNMAESRRVSLVLVGIGGMGACYLEEILPRVKDGRFKLQGVVDPFPRQSAHLAELQSLGIPVYETLERFYAERKADLAVIASPIHRHCPQTLVALSEGSHVLCEKPVAAVIQDARSMSRASAGSGRFAAVGYQWSFSSAIQEVKADILSGVYGRAKRLRCLYLWPRDEAYYHRNSWAGRIRDDEGNWVLDSPANNAMAHDLHNMLYILGEAVDRSARPVQVNAELYRAYPIQNYDTVAARIMTESGAEVLIYFSHASGVDIGPVFSYEFEKGEIMGSGRDGTLKGLFQDGRVKDYGSPNEEPFKKFWDSLDAVRYQTPLPCGIEAAASQTLCINGFQESVPAIVDIPRLLVRRENDGGTRQLSVKGLEETFVQCYQEGLLPSEQGVGWAKPGEDVSLEDYQKYPTDELLKHA
jgi:alpha-mannosidase